MTLRLRKAKGNRPEPPEWDENDYDVISGGAVVGRIYRSHGVADKAQPWVWSILITARPGMTTNGLAESLDEAQAAFSRNWAILMGRAD